MKILRISANTKTAGEAAENVSGLRLATHSLNKAKEIAVPQPNKTHLFVLLVCDFVRVQVWAHDLRFAGVPTAVLLVLSLFAPLARGQYCQLKNAGSRSNLDSLPAVAQAGISGAIGRDQAIYHATVGQNSARMETPARALGADFSSRRVDFHVGAHVWRMRFAGYGYGDTLQRLGSVAPDVEANRVEYHRGMLTEWYVNGPLGLEQGFTLTGAPQQPKGKPLTFAFDLSGDLKAVETPDRHALTLESHESTALRYSGLMAIDASGRELRTWLEVESNRLRLRVDDTDARYPIAIDPIVQAQTVELVACDGQANDQLGFSVAVSADGNTVVASANVAAAAYVFLKPSAILGRPGWASLTPIEAAAKLISSDVTAGDFFGVSTSMSGDGSTIVIGANVKGEAYVFEEPASGWSSSVPLNETAKLTASDAANIHFFGGSVSISGDGNTIVVGASGATVGANANQGKAYVFAKPSTGWTTGTESAVLVASDGAAGDSFGSSGTDDDGGIVVVGAWGASGAKGAAWVFAEPANGWASSSPITETAKLTASDGAENDQFGISVQPSGDGNTIVAGAWWATVNSNFEEGAAYVFAKPAGGWTTSTETAKLTASDGVAGILLGTSVSINDDGSTVVAGAAPVFGNSTPGAAYVFARSIFGWGNSTETMKLAPSNGVAGDEAGNSVGINGNASVIAMGAPDATPGTNEQQGALYIFTGTFHPAARPSINLLSLEAYVGSISSSQSVTLTNSGTVPLDISNVAAAGPFSTSKNCIAASPLAPGGSCTENVTFTASGVGTFKGMLTFTDDAGEVNGSMQQVTLNGTGTQAPSSTSITSLSPNPALVGQSVAVTYSVLPPAGDTLTPSGTVTVNAASGESCRGPAPSSSCTLTFSNPVTRTVTADYGGDANFLSSTSSSVSEQVVDFSLSASPSTLTIPPGHLAKYTLTATSLNGFEGVVSLACAAGPPHSTCTVSPSTASLSNSTSTATATINLENKGTYTLSFVGSYGSLTHTSSVTLIVK